MRYVLRKVRKKIMKTYRKGPKRHFLGWALVLCYLIYIFGTFPDPSELKFRYPVPHYSGPKRHFSVSLENVRPKNWIYLSEIHKSVIGAVVVSEDWSFYEHSGYDAAQIKDALVKDIEKLKFARGGSTITQQVVKNVYLNNKKTVTRKLSELLLALKLDKKVSKNRILEIYLNIIEWGEGVFGIQQASWHYFKKKPSDLSPREAAFLAMMIPSPKKYAQSFRQKSLTRYARSTVDSILKKMVKAGYLEADRINAELIAQLSFEESGTIDEKGLDEDSNEEIVYEPDPEEG